jgi:hypothetical protein
VEMIELVPPKERARIHDSSIEHVAGSEPAKVACQSAPSSQARDLVVRVLITLLPAIPVLFMDEPESPNLISVTLLFGIGYAWAGYIGISRLPLGIMIIAAGLTLSDSPGSADGRSGQRQHRGLRVGDAAPTTSKRRTPSQGDPSWLPTAHHSPAAYGRAAQALEKQADNIKVAID